MHGVPPETADPENTSALVVDTKELFTTFEEGPSTTPLVVLVRTTRFSNQDSLIVFSHTCTQGTSMKFCRFISIAQAYTLRMGCLLLI